MPVAFTSGRSTPVALKLEPINRSSTSYAPASAESVSPTMLDTPALDALSEKYRSNAFTGQFYQLSYGLDSPCLSSPSPTSSTTSSEIAPSHQVNTRSGTAPKPAGTTDSLLAPEMAESGSLGHFDYDCSDGVSNHSAHSGQDLDTEYYGESECRCMMCSVFYCSLPCRSKRSHFLVNAHHILRFIHCICTGQFFKFLSTS